MLLLTGSAVSVFLAGSLELLLLLPDDRLAPEGGGVLRLGCVSIHNILAMQHAGWGEVHLYAGSWSEWIADGSRPVATGPELGR